MGVAYCLTVSMTILLIQVVPEVGTTTFKNLPKPVYVQHIHDKDFEVLSNIEAKCKVTLNHTGPECQMLCGETDVVVDCDICEAMPNSTHLLYVEDMTIYKRPCALQDCFSTCASCIHPGETVTVGVRCWGKNWPNVGDRIYTVATFDIFSFANTNISNCPELIVKEGQPSTSDSRHCSEVSVSCPSGFSLFGAESLTCCGGIWNGVIPNCHKDCDSLYISNGMVSSTLSSHGTEISISCYGGYSLLGTETLTCYNGNWSDEVPVCYKECSNNHFGENCSIPCDCMVNNTVTPDQSCHSYTGTCLCSRFWTGDKCQIECLNDSCDGFTGKYTEVSDSENSVLPFSLGFGLLACVVLIVIISLVLWRKRQKTRSKAKKECGQVSVTDILRARQTNVPRQESNDDPNYCALNFQNHVVRDLERQQCTSQKIRPIFSNQKGQMEYI